MKFLLKSLLLIIVASSFWLLATSPSYAAQEFKTGFTANYTVGINGITSVQQDISLTNRFSNVYATQYALEVGSTRIQNIRATTKSGKLIPHSVTQTENTTAIALTFEDKVVGKGKSHDFTITYKNLDIAVKNGKVLEVNIPRVSNLNDIEDYQVNLKVPDFFGQPSLVTPVTYNLTFTSGTNILSFSKESIGNRGITALFGEEQVFAFTLNYHLENPTLQNGVTQIALPPDTAYQKVVYTNITPKPEKISPDSDGNWLATYTLRPKERVDVTAVGSAVLYLKPTVPVTNFSKDLSIYLKPEEFWPVNDPLIQNLAKELKTPKAIYDYIVDNFSYNYQRLDSDFARLGAVEAINSPHNAICQEFTDTFISLARATGIPARELNGFAYTENSRLRPLSLVQDVLHAWPEYYDSPSQTWIPVDPTWGNTTGGIDYFTSLDLNHFTFVIHGQDSSTPYPAGYYKLDDTISKDISIEFSSELPQQIPSFDVKFHQPSLAILPIPFTASLDIINNSGTAYYNTTLDFASNDYTLAQQSSLQTDILLPFTSNKLNIRLKPNNIAQTFPTTFTLNLLGNISTHEIQPVNLPDTLTQTLILLALAGATLVISLLTWRLLVHRQKR